MNSCEFVTFISALACSIAKDRSTDEITLLGSVFSQLGDTLSTIAAREGFCTSKKTDDDSDNGDDNNVDISS